MIFRRFLLRVLLLVILIALSGLLMVWSFTREDLLVARFTFVLIWILLIVGLVFYVTKTNRTLQTFMESLRYLDTVRMEKGKGRSFEDLHRLYNEIIGIIRKVEHEKETERQYFRGLIDHMGVGLMTFNESGSVEIVNKALLRLFGIHTLHDIKELTRVSSQLPELLAGLKPGYQKLIRISVNHEMIGVSLKVAEFRLQGRRIRLVSVQNIQHELEEEELDAWQKLIRVLTHEIMNSVTPVNSLTHTIIRMFESGGKPKSLDQLDEITLLNALEGLHSIEKRNKGLIGFVQSYRSLTRIQKPAFTDLSVGELFQRIATLIRQDLEPLGIHLFQSVFPVNLHVSADEKLLEQIILNLVNNAVYALQGSSRPEIQLAARMENESVIIEVHDNGMGIPDEITGSIFVPFFTTKEDGSGIGLSLSRQIMRVHGGSISVRSRPGETVFTLRFPI